MLTSSSRLLKLAIPLVKSHGFTHEALSCSVLSLPQPDTHSEPLSEMAVSSLFGEGSEARRTLINAWMEEGLQQMRTQPNSSPTIKEVLRARLAWNEPVLQHLPEAFALLASSSSGLPLDPWPALKHAASVADEACHISGDQSVQLSWFYRRAQIATVYSVAELHQLTSPETAYTFLDSLFDASSSLGTSLSEIELFSRYVVKSWAGIVKSSGVL